MPPPFTQEVTQLLLAWSDGDKAALEELPPLFYAELRRLAEKHMRRERAGHWLICGKFGGGTAHRGFVEY